MSVILEVQSLVYTHKVKRNLMAKEESFVLGPIDFTLKAGQTLAIMGENGAGKTLLAKTLAGVNTPDSGEIILNGVTYEQTVQEHNSQDIRLVLQFSSDSMNPGVTVGALLTQTLLLNTQYNEHERDEKIESTLVKVGLLREHYYYYRHMLSDGQQQRVALARALILDPKVIVADEPFAALDPSVRSQTVNLILKIQKELGLAFIFISHNLGIVRHVSDHIVVMEQGKIVERGITAQIFESPEQEITKKLVGSHYSLVNRTEV